MIPVLLLVLTGAPEPVKLASPGFTGFNVGADVLQFYSDHFAQQLTAQGVRVTTPAEIATLLGLERQKQLMGCQEDSQSCIAELANALGVDGLITGNVGKLGSALQVNLKIISARDGRALFIHSERVRSEELVLDALAAAAKLAARELPKKLERPTAVAEPARIERSADPAEPAIQTTERPSSGLRPWAWLPAGGAAVLGSAGALFLLAAKANSDALTGGDGDGQSVSPLPLGEAEKARRAGPLQQTLGLTLVGAAAAALGTAVYFYFDTPVEPPAYVGGEGAGLAVSWELP